MPRWNPTNPEPENDMPTLKKAPTTPETDGQATNLVPDAPAKKERKKKEPVAERPVVHAEIVLKKCIGKNALTADNARELLGWEEEPDGVTFPNAGVFPELTPYVRKRVRLLNNQNNRPLEMGWVLVLRQELLQKRWRFNGSNLVVGNRNSVMQGQHRLIALVLADLLLKSADEKHQDQREHWASLWGDNPVSMETSICYGPEETDEVFQTLNRERPATAADTIYRSAIFARHNNEDRKELSRNTENAVKLLWLRTGAKRDAFAPHCTPAEVMAFLDRHPKVVRLVKHVWEENKPRKDEDGKPMPRAIGQFYPSVGEVAGFGYLMATSTTDPAKYLAKDVADRSEKQLSFEALDRAEEFFTLLSGLQTGSPEMKHVLTKLAELRGEDGNRVPDRNEKEALLVLAWLAWVAGSPPTKADLDLSDLYVTDEDGNVSIDGDKIPLIGGIDTGGRRSEEESEEATEEPAADPTPDEIADEADKIRQEKANGEQPKSRTRKGKGSAA